MTRRRLRCASIAAVFAAALFGATAAHAQGALDPAAARSHLMQGYQLKKEGKLKEALVHLTESWRLDPQLKTLINLADTEERLGKLVEAQSHWVTARDRAAREGEDKIKLEADKRIGAIERRMPRLTVQLEAGSPNGVAVLRNGVQLGQVSLGTPLPTNPGEHTVVARAPGYEDRHYTVALSEGAQQTLVVTVGAKRPEPDAASAPAGSANAAAPSPEAASDTPAGRPATSSPGSTQRTIGVVTGVVGLAGLGVAAWFYKQASDTAGEGRENSEAEARADIRITNIAGIAGGVLVGTGVLLFVLAPSGDANTSRLPVVPLVGFDHQSATLGARARF